MTFGNLSYYRMFSKSKKIGKYDMMFEIYVSAFKNTFCGKIKLTTK